MRTGRGDRGGETGVVECGDGELVGVSGGGEEREVVRKVVLFFSYKLFTDAVSGRYYNYVRIFIQSF